MLSFRYPSDQKIRDFLDQQSQEPYSYTGVGTTRSEPPAGSDPDHSQIQLGKGRSVFEAACAALRRWEMFPPAWTRIEPAEKPIQEGQVLAMLTRVFGLWWLNSCRIVYVLDEAEPVRRFGFSYGTLPGHIERGEERFSIEWHGDDTVWYDLKSFSRPRFWAVRLGYPITRRLQRRFVRDSLATMQKIAAQSIAQMSAPG